MQKRFFSVEGARSLLPSIKKMVEEAISFSKKLEEHRETVQKLAKLGVDNAGSPMGTAYLENLISLQTQIRIIQETGCVVKNIQVGLIDFPHLKDGREVYLCWKYGEEDIRYWHEVDAGFAGRTLLTE